MYARLCSATGWSWEYVGQCVTLPRLFAFIEYWKSAPPVAESVAAFVGIKAPAPKEAANDGLQAYMANLPLRVIPRP